MTEDSAELRARGALLAALALLTAGAFVLRVALMRVASVVVDVEHASAWTALEVLVAATAAIAAIVGARRGAGLGAFLSRASHGAMLATAAVVVLAIALVHAGATLATLGAPTRVVGVGVTIAVSIPFAVVGATSGAAVRAAFDTIETCCFALFAGVALGSLGAVLLLHAGGAIALLAVAVIFALASLAFAAASWSLPHATGTSSGPRPSAVATCVLAALVLLAGEIGAPWLKLRARGAGPDDTAELAQWSADSMLRVEKPAGPSAIVREDNEKVSAVFDAKATPPTEPEDIGLALHPNDGPVLVVDAGGGRSVRTSSRSGHTDIDATVLDPGLARALLSGPLATLSGNLYASSGVHLVADDGRNFLRRTNRAYRLIVLAQQGAPAANVASDPALDAFRLAGSSLLTIEAFSAYLDHLAVGGTLVVRTTVDRADAIRAVAIDALRARGVAQPERQFFACAHASGVVPPAAAALVVQSVPLDGGALNQLRRFCKTSRFVEVRPVDDAARAGSLPTDDRPSFVPSAKALGAWVLLRRMRELAQSTFERMALLVAFASAIALALGAAVPAFVLWRRRTALPSSGWMTARALAALAGIGVALAWSGSALTRKLTTFVGHPVFALAFVLPIVALALGLGCFGRTRLELVEPIGLLVRGALASALGVLLAFALSPALAALGSAAFALRLVIATAVALLFGIFAGGLVPSAFGAIGRDLAPWGAGMLGLGVALGTATGAVVAAHLGFSAVLLAGAIALGVVAVLLPAAELQSGATTDSLLHSATPSAVNADECPSPRE